VLWPQLAVGPLPMAALSNGWYELVTVLARKVEGLGFESWFGHLSKVGICQFPGWTWHDIAYLC